MTSPFVLLAFLKAIYMAQFCDRFPAIERAYCSHCSDTAKMIGKRAINRVDANGNQLGESDYLVDQTDPTKLVYAPIARKRFYPKNRTISIPLYRQPNNHERLSREDSASPSDIAREERGYREYTPTHTRQELDNARAKAWARLRGEI